MRELLVFGVLWIVGYCVFMRCVDGWKRKYIEAERGE